MSDIIGYMSFLLKLLHKAIYIYGKGAYIMENSLLIGNELNQCLKGGVPWGNLLKTIAEKNDVGYNEENQMPLEFERILNAILEKRGKNNVGDLSGVYDETKSEIATIVKNPELPNNAIHREIPFELFNNILTTNYDTLLERALAGNQILKVDKRSHKYISHRTSKVGNIDFFHPHGIVEIPESICLGYEHYMGVVEKLRSNYNGKTDRNDDDKKNKISKNEKKEEKEMRIYRILTGIDKPKNEWGEKIYDSNVAIIGLGLTECESDLWWILTHRASLYYMNYKGIRPYLNNKIVFFDVMNDIERNDAKAEAHRKQTEKAKKNRHDMLKHVHVEVETYKLSEYNGSYEDIYRDIFGRLKKGIF